MLEPELYDTDQIRERISVFDQRFNELIHRYSEFSDVLGRLNERIDEHLEGGEEALDIARQEQNQVNRKPGLAGKFEKRNQGRINAKLLGAIERDFAILKDVKEITTRNMELINDTGTAVQRDIKEVMDCIVVTIQNFHEATARTLQVFDTDIELLKQLTSKSLLNNSGVEEAADEEEVSSESTK